MNLYQHRLNLHLLSHDAELLDPQVKGDDSHELNVSKTR
jgi:hypothetical protein